MLDRESSVSLSSDKWHRTTVGVLVDKGMISLQTGPFGSQLHSSDYVAMGVPVIPTEGIGRRRLMAEGLPCVSQDTVSRLARHKVRAGDILFARRGAQATGLSALVESEHVGWLCGTGAILMRISSDEVDPPFMSFVLASDISVAWLKAHAVGAVMPNLNTDIIRRLPILLPPPVKQRAIARFLGDIDDKIDTNRRTSETLTAMARALFKSWFIDFDPVRAKSEGRRPAGMDAETAKLFPAQLASSDQEPIPQSWKAVNVGDVATLNSLALVPGDGISSISYVEISGVARGDILTAEQYLRGAEPGRARRRIRHGDTVISMVRPERQAYFLSLDPPENMIVSTGFSVLTPRSVPWSYLHASVARAEVFEYLGHLADGGAYPVVKPDDISALKVVLPEDSRILGRFHHLTSPLYERAEQLRAESRTLTELRDTLLPKLMSGELRIKDAEKLASAAL